MAHIFKLFDLYLTLITRQPKMVLACVAVLTIGLAAGLPNFKLDASSDSLTLENDLDLEYFRDVSKNYQSGDFLVITFKPHSDLFSDESLDILANLKQDLFKVKGVASINSILDVPLLYSPKRSLTEIVRKPLTLLSPGVDRQLAKQEFLSSPIYKELILGPDGQTTALQLNIQYDKKYIELVQARNNLRIKRNREGLSEAEKIELDNVSAEFLAYRTEAAKKSHQRVEDVRQIVASYKDRAQIFVGGVSMITADMIQFIQNDLFVFGSAVILFMILVLALIFRSMRFVIIPMVICVSAVVMMLGYVSWLDWRLTVISSNFVALLLIISLAITIHLVVRYREYVDQYPAWTKEQWVIATVKFMARPCFYTAITTIVAFASLVISGIRPVIDFGWMMTIGLVVALVLGFLIFPAMLMLLPADTPRNKAPDHSDKEDTPLTLVFSNVVEKYGTYVLVGAFVVAVLSGLGISRLQVENRFIDYFHESTEIYQGLSIIDKNLGGTTSLEIILDHDAKNKNVSVIETDEFGKEDAFDDDPFSSDDGFGGDGFGGDGFGSDDEKTQNQTSYWLTVAGLKQITLLHKYLDVQPEIGKVNSLATLYQVGKDINGSLNDFELAVMQRTLPKEVSSVLIAPYLFSDGDQARVVLRIHDTYPNLNRSELVERIKQHVNASEDFSSDRVQFTGLLVLYNNMLQSLFSSQIVTLGAVFLAIMVMFIALFRSFVVAIVAILPNILAAFSVLGAMGLIGLPLDMMTITVAAITVGIGVDDTIHYIHRFKKEVAEDGDYIAAMHRSHKSIGRAMYYTSLIIIFGFAIMILSEFIPTIYFGLLTGLAMFSALMGALLLLPKLIIMTKPFGQNSA